MGLKMIKKKLDEDPRSINVLYRWLNNKEFFGNGCEALCAFLLNNKKYFEEDCFYPELTRADKNGKPLEYRYGSRQGNTGSEPGKDRYGKIDEKHLAMKIFQQCRNGKELKKINHLGYVVDYEMPIGGNVKKLIMNKHGVLCPTADPDKRGVLYEPGKCDLVSYDNSCFTIFELKKESSKEPLIRAVMEAYTYKRLLNKNTATDSFRRAYPELNIPDADITWKAAVLLCKTGSQNKEYRNAGPNLLELIDYLEIRPIWYRYSKKDGLSIVE